MDLILRAARNAGLDIIDYNLEFTGGTAQSRSRIEKVIAHHDVWPGGTMEDIHHNHKIHKLYRGTGYHVRFPAAGGIELGRPYGSVGGHCKQDHMNFRSIGAVYEGNLDKTRPTEAQLRDSSKFFAELFKLNGMVPEDIDPHNKYAVKTCPGTLFDLTEVKERIQRIKEIESDIPDEWAIEAQVWNMAKGISDGTRPHDDTRRQETWVINKRLHDSIVTSVLDILEKRGVL